MAAGEATYVGVSLGDTFDDGRLGPAMAYGEINQNSDPTWMSSDVGIWVNAEPDQRELMLACYPEQATEYAVWYATWPEAE